VFTVSVLFAIGWVVWGTVHPIPDPDGDGRAYSILFVTIFPALVSAPALAGAAVRWLVLERRGHAPALRVPRVESAAGRALVAIVVLGTLLMLGPFWALALGLLYVLAASAPQAS
jgi:hypothetical protein